TAAEARAPDDFALRPSAPSRQLAEDREEENIADLGVELIADICRAEHVAGDGVVVPEAHVLIPAVLDQIPEIAGARLPPGDVDEAEVADAVGRTVLLEMLVHELGRAGARVRVALELRVLLVHDERHD